MMTTNVGQRWRDYLESSVVDANGKVDANTIVEWLAHIGALECAEEAFDDLMYENGEDDDYQYEMMLDRERAAHFREAAREMNR